MARIVVVKKARGASKCNHKAEGQWQKCGLKKNEHAGADHEYNAIIGKCEKCSKLIEPGMEYKHVSLMTSARSSTKRLRCGECPRWKPSELTSSQHRAVIYAVQEEWSEGVPACPEADDANDALSELKGHTEDAASQAREAVDSLNESADNIEDGFGHETEMSMELRQRAEDLEAVIDEIESWEGTEFDEDAEDADVEAWWEDQVAEISELIDSLDAG